ncbi:MULTISPECIES: ROK family transcriptional regulator [Paenibacillus]|uniref:NagC family transcriptional regulator n=1 Tax=Paenibacillus campinasensis TaxID=66347 RepID=A0A268F418_9BACL|nr:MULTISPECIES: ROK family transcriptional regulator [Paenibacillus]MUG64716.1 ROK family protein [Paenibacillus campinasensis]PAD80111.1 NagC family transcriptional regulator [Paenibacillus campinasensis]PAK55436.1 NagC family transcriptional regulator [Paenibacillus sp. 7541]
MDQSITFQDIKKNNYSSIYHLIYQQGKLSKQEIASQLRLSLPTVSQNLVRLEEEQLIAKSGQFESSVGRRATAYAICPQARVAIGVEIQKETVRMLAVDLLGTVIQKTDVPLPYVNADSYYQALSRIVQDFIASLAVTDEQVLGIGLAVQALTSVDGRKITYGKILNFTGLEITAFSQYLKYPCRFVHDAKCAATTELWVRNDIGDAVYLSIGRHLGGAIIINNQIEMGKEGHSGTVEHMTIDRNGPSCYCGKNGCMETYCSVSALLEEGETLDHFFAQLRSGAAPFMARWDRFLDMLALSINNIHLVINREFIIGGHISPYLEEQDLHILHEKVHEKTAFPSHEPFIHLSRSPENGVPVGAAIPFIQSFLDRI